MSDWTLGNVDGLVLVHSIALAAVPGLSHAFSTRRDGRGGDFDLGPADDREELFRDRRARFLAAAGLAGARPRILRQVHGAHVLAESAGEGIPEADGAVWSPPDGKTVPCVRTADCVPVLLADREGRAAAVVHAGWRGTAAGIVRVAVRRLAERGLPPTGLVAALGPAVGPCCYPVGREVVEAVAASLGPGGVAEAITGRDPFRLDLRVANRAQLVDAGLRPDAVHAAPWCTSCRGDLFFSYRRDGRAAGRMMATVGPRG